MKIKLEMCPEYARGEDTNAGVVSKCEVTFSTYEAALAFHQKVTNLVKEHSDAQPVNP